MSWHDLILLSSLVGRCLRTCKGSCAVWRETQMTFSHWQFSCIFVGTAHAKLCSVPTCAQKDTKRIADEAIRFQEGASLTECLSIFFGWRAVSSVCRHVGTKLWHTNYIRQKCLKTAVNVEFVIGPYIYIDPFLLLGDYLARMMQSGVLVPPRIAQSFWTYQSSPLNGPCQQLTPRICGSEQLLLGKDLHGLYIRNLGVAPQPKVNMSWDGDGAENGKTDLHIR